MLVGTLPTLLKARCNIPHAKRVLQSPNRFEQAGQCDRKTPLSNEAHCGFASIAGNAWVALGRFARAHAHPPRWGMNLAHSCSDRVAVERKPVAELVIQSTSNADDPYADYTEWLLFDFLSGYLLTRDECSRGSVVSTLQPALRSSRTRRPRCASTASPRAALVDIFQAPREAVLEEWKRWGRRRSRAWFATRWHSPAQFCVRGLRLSR
jgi:hypothetical protein